MGHGGSSRGGENEGELTGVQFRPSPEPVRRQGGGVMEVELWLRMAMVRVR
jgi:hypothetical protein